MRRWYRSVGAVAVLLAACGGGGSGSGVSADNGWARPTPASATTSAVYFDLRAGVDDELLSASVDPTIAAMATVHETTALQATDNHVGGGDEQTVEHDGETDDSDGTEHGSASGGHDMTEMHAVEAIELPAGKTVQFQPGALHVMLEDLARPLAPGDSFELTLSFAHASPVTLVVEVANE